MRGKRSSQATLLGLRKEPACQTFKGTVSSSSQGVGYCDVRRLGRGRQVVKAENVEVPCTKENWDQLHLIKLSVHKSEDSDQSRQHLVAAVILLAFSFCATL